MNATQVKWHSMTGILPDVNRRLDIRRNEDISRRQIAMNEIEMEP